MMHKVKAFVFDLNGTMVDDMNFHAKAWYQIINNKLHGGLSLEEVKKEMYGKNEEVLERVFGKNSFSLPEMQKLSIEKEKIYQKEFAPHLGLIKGLENFLEKAKQYDFLLAIGTAAIPFNIDFVLDALHLRDYFSVIVSADDVERSKPDPETFIKAAQLLKVDASECIVFEDAPKGVEAAANAGMKAIAITTTHNRDEFEPYKNVLAFIENYTDEFLEKLFSSK
jgi:beta-phosphoglucomutase family hydrolase